MLISNTPSSLPPCPPSWCPALALNAGFLLPILCASYNTLTPAGAPRGRVCGCGCVLPFIDGNQHQGLPGGGKSSVKARVRAPRHRCMFVCTCMCLCAYTKLSILLRGLLKVAEVSSRFEDVRTFLGAVAKLGFKVISKVRAPRSLSLFCLTCGPFQGSGIQKGGHRHRQRHLLLDGTTRERVLGSFLSRGGTWMEVF